MQDRHSKIIAIALGLVLAMLIAFPFMVGPILAAGLLAQGALAVATFSAIASVVALALKGFAIIFDSAGACKASGYAFNSAVSGLFGFFVNLRYIKAFVNGVLAKSDIVTAAFLNVIGLSTLVNISTDVIVGGCK